MSSEDPISSVTEGVTKGFLEFTSEKISLWIKKFKNKELAFIQDTKTIKLVKEQYNSGESKFYKNYVNDSHILFLIRMGLTLRKLEEDKERQQNLRDKIFRKYKIEGLHIVEFVQNGILNRYTGILIEELISVENLQKEIEEILKDIEKYTLFVQSDSNKFEILKKVNAKIDTYSSCIFIISGFRKAASLVRESIDDIKMIMKDYNFERFSSGEKEILFFRRKL